MVDDFWEIIIAADNSLYELVASSDDQERADKMVINPGSNNQAMASTPQNTYEDSIFKKEAVHTLSANLKQATVENYSVTGIVEENSPNVFQRIQTLKEDFEHSLMVIQQKLDFNKKTTLEKIYSRQIENLQVENRNRLLLIRETAEEYTKNLELQKEENNHNLIKEKRKQNEEIYSVLLSLVSHAEDYQKKMLEMCNVFIDDTEIPATTNIINKNPRSSQTQTSSKIFQDERNQTANTCENQKNTGSVQNNVKRFFEAMGVSNDPLQCFTNSYDSDDYTEVDDISQIKKNNAKHSVDTCSSNEPDFTRVHYPDENTSTKEFQRSRSVVPPTAETRDIFNVNQQNMHSFDGQEDIEEQIADVCCTCTLEELYQQIEKEFTITLHHKPFGWNPHCGYQRVKEVKYARLRLRRDFKSGKIVQKVGYGRNLEGNVIRVKLNITIVVSPHEFLQAHGNDLYTSIHLTWKEALFGYCPPLTFLDDWNYSFSAENNQVITNNSIWKIPGKGMTEDGNLYIKFVVIPPTHEDMDRRIASLLRDDFSHSNTTRTVKVPARRCK